MSGYNCVVLALTLNTLAYTIEIFAGYIKATPRGEIEAAYAYGMSKSMIFRRIVLPSALRRALPAYSNEVILMLHSTSLAFTATVPDILKVARDANSATYLTFASYGTAALIYMVVAFVIVGLFRLIERRALAFLAYEKK
jgi:histidine transport system permease protein